MKKTPYISSINTLFAPVRAVLKRARVVNGFGTVRRCALFFVLALAFQATAMAQLDNIWRGTTSTAWSTASNWSLNLVPTTAHNVRIPRAANLPTLSVASVARTITFIDSLTASATATLTVGAQTLTVGVTGFPGNITINNVGVLSISTGTVTLSIGGTMTLNTGGSISMTGAGTIAVSGGWTNNGGTMSNTAGTVSFTGAATKTISGTSSTTFPAISLANTAVYQMSNDNSATSLTFVAGNAASSLTHTGTSALTVNGNVTVNQPTANTTTKAWNINSGSGIVTGTLTVGGTSNTASRVATVVVTTGSLSVTGTTTLTTGTSSAVARIAVGTGSLTFSSALNHNEGTLAFTGAGTMNFNNTYAFASGGSVAPILTTVAGANLNFANNVTVSATGGLTLNAGSNSTFAAASTVTPTTNVSFGNVTVNTGVTVTTATAAGTLTIAGNLLVSGTGNLGGAGTEPVILSGASATIDGTGTIAVATTVSAAHSFLAAADLSLTGTWTINTGVTVTNNGIVTSTAAGGIVGGAASATWLNAANSTLKISGPLLATGTLTAAGNPNTVEYTGASQTVKLPSGAPATYHHLTLSGSGTVVMPATAMTLNGNFTTTGTESATAGAALTINGDVSLGAGTTFNASTFTHIVGGNWTNNATIFTASTGTIVFTGSGVNIGGATTFNRVRIAGTGTKTFTVNHTINDSLNIVAGTLDVGGTTLVVGGNFNNASTFTPSTSTVIFTGSGINVSGATTFNRVRIAGAGIKTFTANHTINDSLNIIAGTLDAGTTTLVVGGNFNNASTFTPSTSTAVFTGSGINVSGVTTFNRVRIAGTGTKTFTANHTINDSLNIVAGTLDVGGTTLVVGGNFNNASTFTPSTSTVIFTGSGINVSGATTFNRVRIAGTGTKTFTANHTINDSLNIVAGTLNGGSATLEVVGNFNNASTFTPSTSTVVFTGSGINVSGATTFNRVRIAGTGTKTFTANHTINDSLNIVAGTLDVGSTTLVVGGNFNNASTFTPSTSTVIFTGSGINVSGAATFNRVRIAGTGTKTFTANHTINDSLNIVGGTLDGGSTTLVVSGNFNNASTFTPSTSTVIFTGSGINVSGATTFNRVRIAGTGTKTFTANHTINDSLNIVAGTLDAGSSSLAVKGNFNNDATFTASTSTVTFSGTAAQDINGTSTTSFNHVTISNTIATVSLSANVNISGTFTINANAVFQPAAVVVINNAAAQGTITGSGTIHVTRTAATPDYSSQYKFTTNTLSGLTVNYSGAGAQTVNALSYGGLTLSGSGTKTFGGATGIAGNFVVSGVTADATTNLTTITMNGTTAQQAAGITYRNLTINNIGGSVALSGSAAIDSLLTLTNGTFSVGANTLTFNGSPISGTATNLSAGATSSIVFNGTKTGMFLPSSVTTLNDLTVNVHPISNKITHNGALTINGILSLTDGILDNMPVSPDTLTIENGASVSRVNGRLRGAMKRYIATGAQTVVYDVGGNDLITPVTLQFSNVTTPGYVTVRMLFGDHAQIATSGIDQNLSINRNYVIRPNGIAFSSTYNVTLGYGGITPDDMDPGATPANFIVRRYDGTTWSKTTVGTRTDTSTQATGLTQFGVFQVGEQLVKTWDGGASTNNWGDALNWNPDGVPTALEDVTLDGANAIDVNVAATSNTLTLTNPSLLLTILSGNSLAVTGDLLAQDGTLNTQAAFPSVTGSVSITGGTIGYTASSGSQTVVVQPYNNLTISGGGTKTLAGTITPTGNLTISGGTFDLGSFTANRSAAGGTLTVANGAILKIGSTNTRPTNYNTHSIGATSTVEYAGSNQSIGTLSSLQSYGHLILSGSGTKTFPSGTTGIVGDLTISGVTADATTNSSTIEFKGSGSQVVAAMNYYNVIFSNAGTKTFATGTSRIANTFTMSGTASADATTNSTTIEYNGASAQAIPAFIYNNLTINNSAGVSISGSTTVNGTLTLTSGNVTTSSNTLTIASTGSVSRTSGHIVGKLAKYVSGAALTPTFEIGDASNYTPVNITFASVSTAGSLTASTTSGDHFQIITSGIDGSKSVNRYWTLTNSGIVFTTYDVTFNFVAGDIDGGASTSNFIVGNYNGSTWTLPTVGTKTSTSTQVTGLSGFNDFQIGEPSTGVTKTWDGGAGTSNWGDSQNWSPDGVPISTDNINLNGSNIINVNVAAVGNSITLNNSTLTLTILSGNSLTISSNLTLTSGTLNTQGAFPSVAGTVNITGGTVGYTGTTGSQTVNALSYFNLTLSGAATKTIAASTTSIAGNFTVSGGSVDATTNGTTITLNGTGSQAVAAINYKHLTFSNTGTRTFVSGTIGIAGDFTVTGGSTDATTNTTTIDFNGSVAQAVAAVNYHNLTMSVGGTKTLASGTVGVAGNFTISGGTVNATANNTTVNFNGSGTQAVPAINYYSLTMSNGGTKTFGSGTIGIAKDFVVTGGTVDATTNTTTININGTGAQAIAAINYHNLTVSMNGGTKTFASGTTGIAGNFTLTAGVIDATSNSTTIDFNGSGTQAVAAVNYHNLIFSNGGTKTFASGTTGIAGNFMVSGGTANATANSTTIDFNGSGTQAVAAINYYNLAMSNGGVKTFASGTTTISGNYTVSASTVNATSNTTTVDFNAASGTQDVAAINYYNLTFSGGGTKRFASGTSKIASAFMISAGTADATTNTPTIEYNGSSSQTIRAITYSNLTINNSAGASIAGNITVNGTLNFISGNISTGADKVTISSTGTVTRTSGHVIGNFEKYIPTIVPTRTFEVGDANGYTPVTVSFGSVSTPNYLTITTNAADHAQIGTSVVDSTLTANRTWTVTNAGVVFTNYSITLGFLSSDLDVGANANNFIVGRYSGGSWSYPTVGTKTATSTQATGLTAFGDFQVGEQAGTTKTWVGLAGDLNWNTAINWNPATVPISTDNVNLNVDSTITVNTAAVSNSITLNSPNLVLHITTGNSLTASGTFTMLNGTLKTEAAFPSVTGSVSLTGGTVEYSAAGVQTISARTYNKLTLSGSGNKSAAGALTVNDSLQILGAAVFNAGTSLTHIFKGHWLVNSSAGNPFIYTTASTVNFNNPSPAGARNLDGTSSSTIAFNIVNVNNTSGLNVNLNISASGNLTVATNVALTPGASNIISGAGTLTGSGTVKVTRTTATADFSSQYTITNKTLTNLTVDYAASGQVLSNLTYGGLKVSGSITGASNSATVGGAFTVTGTFTPTSGTMTMNNGSSIVNSTGTLTFSNLTIANSATSTTSSSFSIGGALSVGTGATFTASSGTITMNNGASISNSNSLTFNNLTIANSATVTTSSSFTVGGALSVGTTAVFTPSGGTMTMNNGSSIANSGTLTFSGLTIANAATVTTSSSFSVGGVLSVGTTANFSPSGGTITMNNGSSVSNSGTLTFSGLTVAASATVAESGSVTVAGTLTIGTSSTFTPSGTVTANGNIVNSGSQTGAGTILLSGGASAHVLSGGGSFTNLQVNDTQGATLSSGTTVNGTLTLTAGKITTGANTLTLSATGSVSRTSGHVVGNLAKDVATGFTIVRTFEIGDATNYTPVSVTFAHVTGGGGGILTATTTSTDHPNIATSTIDPTSSANRYWTLTNTGVSFSTYDVTFTFVAGDVDAGADPLQFIVGNYTGAAWAYPTLGTRTATTTQATGLTAFGDFQLGLQQGGTFTSTATGGNWSATTTWSGGQVPGAGADVVISTTGSNTVTIDANTASIRSVTINSGAILNGGGSFTLSFGADGGNDFTNNGTFTANAVTVKLNKNSQWTGSGVFNLNYIDFNSKTLTLAFASANTIYLAGNGDPMLNAGTLVPGTNSTIEYNGTSAQNISSSSTINFRNLRITNSAVVTLQKSLTATNLLGNLTITSGGILNTANGSQGFDITGATGATLTVDANSTLNIGGTGLTASSFPTGFTTVTLNAGSTIQYNNSSSAAQTVSASPSYGNILFSGSSTKNLGSGSFSVAGDWTNNSTGGSLSAGTSTVTLTGTSKNIGGIDATTFATLNIDGTYTNNGANTINTALGGSGTLTQAASATLNLNFGGSLGITSLVAGASGNTVNYQFAGAQTVRAMNYTNLTLSGSGTKTLSSGTTSISGNFAVPGVTVDATTNSSTVDYNGGGSQTIAAIGYMNLTLSNAGTKTFSSGTTQIAGSFTISGATADATTNLTTINYNGTSAQSVAGITYYNVSFTNAGLKTIGVSTTVNSNVTITSGANVYVSGSGTLLLTGDMSNDGVLTNDGVITAF